MSFPVRLKQSIASQTIVFSLGAGTQWIPECLQCFRSVHFAIVLLSLLAVGTLIGVVMPQEGMVEMAAIKRQFGTHFNFFQTLGFFHVYSSFWFITLQVLFFSFAGEQFATTALDAHDILDRIQR
jgi:hypothetical protein